MRVNRADWISHPIVDKFVVMPFNHSYSSSQFTLIKNGFKPKSMEDRWFIYFMEDRLYLHRSWTGNCIYIVDFDSDGNATNLTINNDSTKHTYDPDKVCDIVTEIIDTILLQPPSPPIHFTQIDEPTPVYTLDRIKAMYNRGDKLKYIYFSQGEASLDNEEEITKDCFSQCYKAPFKRGGVWYQWAMQYVMAQKALLFDDEKAYRNIIRADSLERCRELDKTIANFSQEIWELERYKIVVDGNSAKFNQNPKLKDFLINTGYQILVATNCEDKVWSACLAQENSIDNPHNWTGENLLGFALMEVRDILISMM